jgi:hypothetical protein
VHGYVAGSRRVRTRRRDGAGKRYQPEFGLTSTFARTKDRIFGRIRQKHDRQADILEQAKVEFAANLCVIEAPRR